jgi:predicted transport protein
MYKVEYLVIVEKINTTTIASLKNLLQSDDEISLNKNILKFNKNNFQYKITKGNVSTGNNSTYFHLKFYCKELKDINQFTTALRKIRGRLSMINKKQFTLWDDISKHYSSQAYDKIYHIENLMRKLLTKFMLVNLGMNWTSDRVPNDVNKSKNINNNDINFLNNIDFIKLSDFLFSENYPSHKESVLKKLNQAKDLSSLNIEEIRSLLPESNWSKYFASIVECEGDYLNKIWKKLYDLRNSIAHNKTFSLSNLEEAEKLTSEIGEYLEDAISKLDEVVVPEEEIEEVVESVISEKNEDVGHFIENYRQLEYSLQTLNKQINNSAEQMKRTLYPIQETLSELGKKSIIPKEIVDNIKRLSKVRNLIIHGRDIDYNQTDLKKHSLELEEYTENIKFLLEVDETDHLDKIKNQKVLDIYSKIKSKIIDLEEVDVKYNKHYISFIKERNIVDIKLQQKALKIWVNLNKGELNDPEMITKDVSSIGHLGNGDYEIKLNSLDKIDYIMGLIIQSYNYHNNN